MTSHITGLEEAFVANDDVLTLDLYQALAMQTCRLQV